MASQTPDKASLPGADLARFEALLREHEGWLMRRTLEYAGQHGYTKYTSALAEAWRASIVGLTESLTQALDIRGWNLAIDVDEDAAADPVAAFGIHEAAQHRARGITLVMFLGLMKYYRRAYLDLVAEHARDEEEARCWEDAVQQFFDRVELGFCGAWLQDESSEQLMILQAENRAIRNEKNKYLAIFESLSVPVLFVGGDGRVDSINAAAARAFNYGDAPGATHYSRVAVGGRPAVLGEEIAEFIAGGDAENRCERALPTADGLRHFAVSCQRMLDVSDRLAGATVVLGDITECKHAEEALHDMSLSDHLTGLDNRRGFYMEGGQLLRMARRLRRPVAMLFVDLDDLKGINDEFGHSAGDEALKDLGRLLRETLRDSDVAARLGGDEFGALVVADGPESLASLVARLEEGRRALNERPDRRYALGFSVGTAACADPAACTLEQLVAEADANMYAAKRARRRRG